MPKPKPYTWNPTPSGGPTSTTTYTVKPSNQGSTPGRPVYNGDNKPKENIVKLKRYKVTPKSLLPKSDETSNKGQQQQNESSNVESELLLKQKLEKELNTKYAPDNRTDYEQKLSKEWAENIDKNDVANNLIDLGTRVIETGVNPLSLITGQEDAIQQRRIVNNNPFSSSLDKAISNGLYIGKNIPQIALNMLGGDFLSLGKTIGGIADIGSDVLINGVKQAYTNQIINKGALRYAFPALETAKDALLNKPIDLTIKEILPKTKEPLLKTSFNINKDFKPIIIPNKKYEINIDDAIEKWRQDNKRYIPSENEKMILKSYEDNVDYYSRKDVQQRAIDLDKEKGTNYKYAIDKYLEESKVNNLDNIRFYKNQKEYLPKHIGISGSSEDTGYRGIVTRNSETGRYDINETFRNPIKQTGFDIASNENIDEIPYTVKHEEKHRIFNLATNKEKYFDQKTMTETDYDNYMNDYNYLKPLTDINKKNENLADYLAQETKVSIKGKETSAGSIYEYYERPTELSSHIYTEVRDDLKRLGYTKDELDILTEDIFNKYKNDPNAYKGINGNKIVNTIDENKIKKFLDEYNKHFVVTGAASTILLNNKTNNKENGK